MILSDDPVAVDPITIRDIEVLETIKEGQAVYRARWRQIGAGAELRE